MNLLNGFLRCYRTVVANNFFTTISLAKRLLEDDTYLIGTLRSNRAGVGNEIREENLHHGEVYGRQNRDVTKLIKWRDKRDVLMISTRPLHLTTVVDSGKTNFQNKRIMKSQVVLDYNKERQGIDLSDQPSVYYTCLRRSIKWYRKVAFELIFETAIVNSYLIYKENDATSDVTILRFRESLVRSLLLGITSEKLKPGPRKKSTVQTKRKLIDHKLEELERSIRDVRRCCAGCYEKNQTSTIKRS
jgi:Transposase IS4